MNAPLSHYFDMLSRWTASLSAWGTDWRSLLANVEAGRGVGPDYGSIHLHSVLGLTEAVYEAGRAVDRDGLPFGELALFLQSSDLHSRLVERCQLYFGASADGAAYDVHPPPGDDPDLTALRETLANVALLPRQALPLPAPEAPAGRTESTEAKIDPVEATNELPPSDSATELRTASTEAKTGSKSRRKRDEGKDDKCLGIYMSYIDRNETPPSLSVIAERVGCSRSTACRAIKPWEEKRLALAKETAPARETKEWEEKRLALAEKAALAREEARGR